MGNMKNNTKKNRKEKNENIESNQRQQIAEFADVTSNIEHMQSKLGDALVVL